MKFNDHLKIVRNCENESDLSHEWIKSIIASQDHKKSLKLRWEKKNQNGRLDLALGFEGREVCIVELKSPTVENIEDFRIQLHRYIYAQNFWRHGSLNPALGILTNGKKAILMDGRKDFLSATKTSVILNLEDGKEFLEFKNIIKRLSWGERGHKTHSAVETDNRENAVDVIDK